MSVCCCQLFPSLAIKHKESVGTEIYYLFRGIPMPTIQIIEIVPRPMIKQPLKEDVVKSKA